MCLHFNLSIKIIKTHIRIALASSHLKVHLKLQIYNKVSLFSKKL